MAASNTGENRQPGAFVKNDPRINRKGRPRSFDALRNLAQQVAHEEDQVKGIDGEYRPKIVNGRKVTKIESIVRGLAESKDPRQRQLFVEIAFGKVPNVTEVSGSLDVTLVKGYRSVSPDEWPGDGKDKAA